MATADGCGHHPDEARSCRRRCGPAYQRPRPAAAHVLSDHARGALLIAAAVALGFRFYGSVLDAAAAVAVLVALAAAISALFEVLRGNVLGTASMRDTAGALAAAAALWALVTLLPGGRRVS